MREIEAVKQEAALLQRTDGGRETRYTEGTVLFIKLTWAKGS